MREITYAEAVREAMSEEMRRDENVFFMGEDIGVYNGAFGVSKGMIQEFGEERVRETPISEAGFVGAGVGAAMMGMRPIVELMFSDFMTVCWDQIANEAAKVRMMLGGAVKVPMVIRMASGGGTGAAAQHSQSLENLYCHIPGLKVVVPSTAYDAKGLLKSAIRDDNPVIFLEQKRLYRVKGEVPEEDYTVPLGKADVKREGSDITIVTYGRMVQMSLEVADKLAGEGIEAEVIDVRTLVPLDTDCILDSVKKTHRVVIVHEAVQFSGFGAEIAAQIAGSEAFFCLDAPVLRVGGYYTPIPFNPILEASVFPTPERIEAAVREALASAAAMSAAVSEGAAAPAAVAVFASATQGPRMTLLARRIATTKGLDISGISGSGVGGRVCAADLAFAPCQIKAAEPQAEAAKVQTEASELQAEASGLQAEASELQVEASEQHGFVLVQPTGESEQPINESEQPAVALESSGNEPEQLEGASEQPGTATELPAALPEEAAEEPESGDEIIRMNGMRRVIAQRMAGSAHETAPVSQFVEIDVTELLEVRKLINAGLADAGAGRVTVTAFILRAMAFAAREHERFRMQMGEDGDSFILKNDVNIGVAVGAPEGLTVPVLFNADKKSIEDISSETTDLSLKAREGKLPPDAYTGGVITLTNMGMYGVTAFTPIINQPEASILGVGAPTERLVREGDHFANRSYMYQSLTYDHRIINGTEAALFQQRIKELLEHPEVLL